MSPSRPFIIRPVATSLLMAAILLIGIVGFRQLPIERWVTTPLYILEFTYPENAGRLHLPLKVKVQRRAVEDDDDPDPAVLEEFHIEEIEDARGAVRVELRRPSSDMAALTTLLRRVFPPVADRVLRFEME